MRKKLLRLLLSVSLISGSLPVQLLLNESLANGGIANQQIITTDPVQAPANPSLSGSRLVWEDYRNGYADIYFRDLAAGNADVRLSTDKNDHTNPVIWQDKVVWEDWRDAPDGKAPSAREPGAPLLGNNLFLKDLTTGEEIQITSGEAYREGPDISENCVIWAESRRSGGDGLNVDIYMYDIARKESAVISKGRAFRSAPAVSGNTIAWLVWSGVDSTESPSTSIHLYDVTTKTERVLPLATTMKNNLALDGKRLFWEEDVLDDERPGGFSYNTEIHTYNLDSGEGTILPTAKSMKKRLSVSGERIVWEDSTDYSAPEDSSWGETADYDICMYDLSTGKQSKIVSLPGRQYSPAISNECVAWLSASRPHDVLYASAIDITAPTLPFFAQISADKKAKVALSWAAAEDSNGISGYEVVRSAGGTSSWKKVGTPKGPTFSETVSPSEQGKTVSYKVRALDTATPPNYSEYSEAVSVFVPDATAPTNPTGLTWARSGAKNELSWRPSTDNVGITGYQIERKNGPGGGWTSIKTVDGKTTRYIDSLAPTDSLKPLTYRVRAFDEAGNFSGYSVLGFTGALNDANADLRSDAIAFYDYGKGTGRAWVFESVPCPKSPAGIRSVVKNWKEGAAGEIDRGRQKAVTGDFNGDGKTDIMAMKNDGNGATSLWLYASTGSSYAAPKRLFWSEEWEFKNNKLVAGDFNADGKDELISFYAYGPAMTKAFLFQAGKNGTLSPKEVFSSNAWDLKRTKLVRVNASGKAKVAAVYDYGNAHMALWVFEANGRGILSPEKAFDAPAGTWDASRSRFVATDVNTDGASDLVALYDYGNATTGVFLARGTGRAGSKAFSAPEALFTMREWDARRSTLVAGDFNGDGKGDLAAAYDYGNATTALWVFASNGKTLTGPTATYQTSQWNNRSATWLMPY